MNENFGEKPRPELPEEFPSNPAQKLEEKQLRESSPVFLQKALERNIITEKVIGEPQSFQEGESSAVFKLTTEHGPIVVKMVNELEKLQNEIDFLDAWRDNGVKTPAVELRHQPDADIPAAIATMEYIDAPTLGKKMKWEELINQGKLRELGQIQARMHQATGVGFGEIRGKKHFETFREEAEKQVLGKRAEFLLTTEPPLTTPEHITKARKAIDLLEADISAGRKPSYTHNDFFTYNVLATEPLTVIDPEPQITHPYMCLGMTVLKARVTHPEGGADEILRGYEDVTGPVDERLLHAAMILKAISRLRWWSQRGKTEWVKQTQMLLDSVEI